MILCSGNKILVDREDSSRLRGKWSNDPVILGHKDSGKQRGDDCFEISNKMESVKHNQKEVLINDPVILSSGIKILEDWEDSSRWRGKWSSDSLFRYKDFCI